MYHFPVPGAVLHGGRICKRFVINGSIPGIKDGLEVGLYDNNYEKVVDATAVTKDGKFMLEGKLEHPVLCMLFVDMSPEVKDMYQKERRGSWIFLVIQLCLIHVNPWILFPGYTGIVGMSR